MLSKEFHNVIISGIACAVPNNKLLTDSYIERFGANIVERFKKATGIESRYISDGTQTASDLCYVAATELLKKKNLTGNDIDALVFVTQTPDYLRPSTAFVLHKRLAIKQDCVVFDVNLGCSAFVNGVYMLSGMIESGSVERALLLIGDAGTLNESNNDDTSFNMMFGDAGSAILLERGSGNIRGMIRSDGEGFNKLITPIPGYRFPGVYKTDDPSLQKKMDGDDVFLFTITKVPKLFRDFYETFNCSVDDFDYYLLHQANMMILNQISKKLKLPVEKVPQTLKEFGNTDGASISINAVSLSERLKEKKHLRLIASGFGIGLSWGIVSFEIDSDDILPMIYTSDYYLEGKNV